MFHANKQTILEITNSIIKMRNKKFRNKMLRLNIWPVKDSINDSFAH